MLLFKNQQKSKNTLKIQKKTKNISFLKSISNFKISYNQNSFDVTFTKLSNDNINYVPKQNRSSWLFVQRKFKKNQKKVKTQKTQKQQPYCYTTSFSSFSNEQNCLLHSLNFIFFVNIYSTFSQ